MDRAQTSQGSATGKWGVIAASIAGAVLLSVSIWSLYRALNSSPKEGPIASTSEVTMPATGLSQEDIESQYLKAEQRTAPVIPTPVAAQPTIVPTNQNDAINLQKKKAKVNRQLVEKLKQYEKEHPYRDNWELEKQIKMRENRGATNP